MAMQHWSDEIIIVDLPDEPEMASELTSLANYITEKENCSIVVDFTSVGDITSSSLSQLLKLRQLTAESGRRLVLCNIDSETEDILSITGLDGIFDCLS